MKHPVKPFFLALAAVFSLLLNACYVDDPGPLQEVERQYAMVDFDRLEIGDALHIEVTQGEYFAVNIRGDRRNIEDLEVTKEGTTLLIRYDKSRQRRHDTFVTITMPQLYAANFSGASESRVHGFSNEGVFNILLSGASVCQLDVEADEIDVVLSGASYLSIRGTGDSMKGDVSGASTLKAFACPVQRADLSFSGASHGEVEVYQELQVVASGASNVVYRGTPAVASEVTGASSVQPY